MKVLLGIMAICIITSSCMMMIALFKEIIKTIKKAVEDEDYLIVISLGLLLFSMILFIFYLAYTLVGD